MTMYDRSKQILACKGINDRGYLPLYKRLSETPEFVDDVINKMMSKPKLAKKWQVSETTVYKAINTETFQRIEDAQHESIDAMVDSISDNCTRALRTWAKKMSEGKHHDKDEVNNLIKALSRISPRFKDKVQHTTLDEVGEEKGIDISVNFTCKKEKD